MTQIPEIPDLSGLHPLIDKQMVRDMWGNFHDPNSGWSTTIGLTFEQNPLWHAKTVFKWSKAQINEVWKAIDWGTPYPNPPSTPKLSVSEGEIRYGGEYMKLAGVSRIEAAERALKIDNHPLGWGAKYSQQQYEQDLIQSNINYVRHLGVKNTAWLYYHCDRMRRVGIIVEVCVYRVNTGEGILVNLEDMGNLAKLGNVFFDVCNEFEGTDEREVAKVINIADNLLLQGCLVSAGAWTGKHGKRLSHIFHTQFDAHQIESHHREWEEESFYETVRYNKPVVFSEYFSQGNLTLKQTKRLMDLALASGCQGVCYYGFRFEGLPNLSTYDPFPYKDMLNYAGGQCV